MDLRNIQVSAEQRFCHPRCSISKANGETQHVELLEVVS